MSTHTIPPPSSIVYPDSDGKPMSDNTKQFRWMTTLAGNLDALYRDDPNVFIGGDLLWYPVEGHPEIRYSPDVFVVFGRPKGDRGSYKQWVENNVPLTVAFEILSPSNTEEEMVAKHLAYEEYGVEEYYVYDPDTKQLTVYKRGRAALVPVRFQNQYISPRMKVRFDLTGLEMVVYYPNGNPFLTFTQIYQQQIDAKQLAKNDNCGQTRPSKRRRRLSKRRRKRNSGWPV